MAACPKMKPKTCIENKISVSVESYGADAFQPSPNARSVQQAAEAVCALQWMPCVV